MGMVDHSDRSHARGARKLARSRPDHMGMGREA